jgi:DNA invertase Pin-like site-specific DNA recombinase
MMVSFLATFAEFERDLLSERVKAGMADAHDKGKHVGRTALPPYAKNAVLDFLEEGRSSQI